MSTKTNFKRIALVAVASLGLGVFTSIAPAKAAILDGNVYANSTNGTYSDVESIGLLAASDANGALAQTAVLLSTGVIAVGDLAGSANTAQNITVSGGIITPLFSNAGNGTPPTPTVSGTSQRTITAAASGAGEVNEINVAIAPIPGANTMTITWYDGATTTSPVARVVVTIAATSAYNVFSAADSTVYWGAGAGADTALTDATASNSSKANASTLAGTITLSDVYGNTLTSGAAGYLTATVTGGGVVTLGSNSVKGSTPVAFSGATGAEIPFNIQQAVANAPAKVTVTFAWNNVTFATKSGTIAGEVAKVTISSPKIGSTTLANATSAIVSYADALGNPVFPGSGTSAVGATMGTVISGLTVQYTPNPLTTPNYLTWVCSNSGVAKGIQVQHLNTSGTVITSNAVDAGCSTAPVSWTASWDKASYTPGSIATLTLTFKDSSGNLLNAMTDIGTGLTVTGGPSVTAIQPITAGDKVSGVTGTKTYQYVVGTVEGDYVAVITPPTTMSTANPLAANASLPYSVKAGTASVSNAEVLKSIVALIASINKQIRALQKLILKR